MTPAQTQNSKANELLEIVNRFGSLLSTQLARNLYPAIKPTSAQRQTQRLIQALLALGLILAKRDTRFEPLSISLSEKGARTLRAYGTSAKSGKDISPGKHRNTSNEALIGLMLKGFEVYTEHEILTEKAPCKEHNGKVADGLAYKLNERIKSTLWLEVEAAKRGGRDLATLCQWLISTLPTDLEYKGSMITSSIDAVPMVITQVLFILAVKQAQGLEARILNKLTQLIPATEVDMLMARLIFIIKKEPTQAQILDQKPVKSNKIKV